MVSTTRELEVCLLQPRRKAPDRPQRPGKPNRLILVVEDDAPTLRLERVIMEEEGYQVEVVGSGEAALDFLAKNSPSLVILDIGLPGMDGFATCTRIREASQVPIIIVTGRNSLDDKVKGMDGGADDYVTKPFLTHELATRVKVALRRSNPPTGPRLSVAASALLLLPAEPHFPVAASTPLLLTAEPRLPVVDPAPPPPAAVRQLPVGGVTRDSAAGAKDSPALPPATSEPPDRAGQVPSSAPASGPTSPPAAANPIASGRSYEGTVRLAITTRGPVRNLITFVSELRQNSKFRVLRLVANQRTEGMDIWLGLRGPMPLVELLAAIHGVHTVVPGENPDKGTADQLLKVTLD